MDGSAQGVDRQYLDTFGIPNNYDRPSQRQMECHLIDCVSFVKASSKATCYNETYTVRNN